jgi:sucrose-6-phosphate hydrolase SacC (GH32 family)
MPNTSWTNEPYGLIHYNNKYHLFFQKNPNGPYLYFMHWGHLSSPDLVNWTEEKIPIRPDPGFDDFGVWSGATIKDADGVPIIYYTGVNGHKAGIGMATPVDDSLIVWNKAQNNPLIPNPPASFQHQDFRDPYLWQIGDTYYMIVGSGLSDNRGGILFTYKSTDMVNWTSISPLYYSSNTAASGTFWEMPSFIQLTNNTWMLQITPIFPGQRARVLYWLGEFINEKFVPFSEDPKPFELIPENMLAPAFGYDEQNSPTYIGIVPEDRDVSDQIKAGWRHTFSLPRELRMLEDTTIGHIPHRNLCRLRGEHTAITERVINPGSAFNLSELDGNQIELKFAIKADSASKFSIQLFKHEDAVEFTSLSFDLEKNTITLDKRYSTLSNASKNMKRADYVFDYNDTIHVNIFLDHSVLEVFVDQLTVFSTRVYPSRVESQKVDLVVNAGTVKVIQVDQWQMADMNVNENAAVCIPENLPSSFRYVDVPPVDVPVGVEVGQKTIDVSVYPIPAKGELRIKFKENSDQRAEVTINSLQGQVLRTYKLHHDDETIDISGIQPGLYIVKIRLNKKEQIIRVIIS